MQFQTYDFIHLYPCISGTWNGTGTFVLEWESRDDRLWNGTSAHSLHRGSTKGCLTMIHLRFWCTCTDESAQCVPLPLTCVSDLACKCKHTYHRSNDEHTALQLNCRDFKYLFPQAILTRMRQFLDWILT